MTDVTQLFSKLQSAPGSAAGTLKINPEALKGVEYRFNINPASTVKANKDAEIASLERLMSAIGKFQNIFKDDPRVEVNWGEMMSAYEQASDIKGASQFIKYDPSQPSPHQLQQQMEQMKNQPEPQQLEPPKQVVNYKDAPEDIKRQMEQADGYQPSQNPMTPEMALKGQEADHKQEVEKGKLMLDAHAQGHQQQADAVQADQADAQAQQSAVQADKSHALAQKTQADSHEVAKKSATMKAKQPKSK